MIRFLKIWLFVFYFIPLSFAVNYNFVFSYFWVCISLCSFYFGSFLLDNKKQSPVNYNSWMLANRNQLFFVFLLYFFSRIEIINNVLNHIVIGDYIQWSLENAVSRYNGNEEDKSFIYQLGTIFYITYSFLLGSVSPKNYKKLDFLLFLFILVIESNTLGRAGIFMCIITLISEIVIRRNNYFQTVSFRGVLKLISIVLILFSIIFLYSAYNRLDEKDDKYEILVSKTTEYAVAPYQAFYVWYNNPSEEYKYNYPFINLFTSLYKLVGVKIDQGFLSMVNTDFGYTNIFTVFRAFYDDLGPFLTSIVFFFFGFFLKYVTYKKMNFIQYFFARSILGIFTMIVISPYHFTTYTVASLFSLVFLYYNYFKIHTTLTPFYK